MQYFNTRAPPGIDRPVLQAIDLPHRGAAIASPCTASCTTSPPPSPAPPQSAQSNSTPPIHAHHHPMLPPPASLLPRPLSPLPALLQTEVFDPRHGAVPQHTPDSGFWGSQRPARPRDPRPRWLERRGPTGTGGGAP